MASSFVRCSFFFPARYLLFLFIEVAQRNVYHLKRNNGDIIRILLADEKVWVVDDLAFVSTVTHSHKLRSQTKAHDTLLTLSLSPSSHTQKRTQARTYAHIETQYHFIFKH